MARRDETARGITQRERPVTEVWRGRDGTQMDGSGTTIGLTATQVTATQALVSRDGKFRRGSIRRFDALYGWGGAASGGASFNKTTGMSSTQWTMTLKMEAEAAFHAVRLLWRNVAQNALANCSSVVGVTETNDNSTSALMASPTIGGSTYQALAAANTLTGWRAVTYAGASTVSVPASTTGQTYALSDEVPITSIARTDGGARPLLLYRCHHNGALDGNWALHTVGATTRTPSAALRNRTLAVSNAAGTDGVAALTATHGLSTSAMECYPIVRHAVPVLSVWAVGDSIAQNNALVADGVSAWAWRACLDASTPTNPVVFANFGASSQGAAVYLANARSALAAGAPAPSVLVIGPCSVNDIAPSPYARTVEAMRATAHQALQLARDYDIPAVIWWPVLPANSLTGAGDLLRTGLNADMQALAAQCGVTWMTFPGLGDGAAPEKWVPALNFGADGIHPNETAIDTIMAPALAGLLRALAVQ